MAVEPPGRRLFPLRLCEVLEKEYVTLHGPFGEPVGGSPAKEASAWLLTKDDIRLPKLIECLRTAAADRSVTPLRVICTRLQHDGLEIPQTGELPPGALEQLEQNCVNALNAALNAAQLLYDPNLLDADTEAFRLAELQHARRTSRHLFVATPSSGEHGLKHDREHEYITRDERLQLNRLLLEAAFPPDVIDRVDRVRLARLYSELHRLGARGGIRSALCLSGGGIRSASFSLGILQGLARHGILDKFDYLSTVSGGGYVGSWLSTWIHRHPEGLRGVTQALKAAPDASSGKWSQKLEPSPEPVRFLRDYSHFLNPKAGFFSVDTWAWIGLYLRNLSLNWLVIIPLLLLLLALPRLYAAVAGVFELAFQPVKPTLFWLATLAGICVVACATLNRPSASEPAKRAGQSPATKVMMSGRKERIRRQLRQQKWILATGVVPLIVFLTIVTVMIWGLPAGRPPIPLDKSWQLISGTPLSSLPLFLPYIGLDHIVLWGELIVALGWLVSVYFLPRSEGKRRMGELLAMLVAGAVTWWLVAWFAEYISLEGPGRHAGMQFLSSKIYPSHLYAVAAVPGFAVAILAGMTAFIGIVSKFKWIQDEDREWWARFGAWILIAMLAWLALGTIAVFGPVLLFESPKAIAALGGVSGLIGVLLGKSALTPVSARTDVGQAQRALTALGVNTLALVAALFLVIFLAFLSLLTSGALFKWMPIELKSACGTGLDSVRAMAGTALLPNAQTHLELICQMSPAAVMTALACLLVFVAVGSLSIDLNKFSLHGAYRIRIARTFLGASRGMDRRPNPFTGFDPLDNVRMHELQPGLLREIDLLDLGALVMELHNALTGKPAAPAARALVKRICSREHDHSRLLEGALRSFQPQEPVLVSLQRDLIETLNRVLDAEHLDRSGLLEQLVNDGSADAALVDEVHRYIAHDSRIFANRLLLEKAFPNYIRKYDFPPPPPYKLMHVVNLTLNLVRGRRLAWQERKAAPFTVTPMHSGSYYVGYRKSRDYGGEDGISIGTAAAISGAAVSPNMGYSSSPITTLLLTLFNVRLGWWLGNPGTSGARTYALSEPLFSLRPLLSEAFGLTDDRSPYVYLSDGGHFDNLGIFEMVLRRCHLIVVVDAGADPKYQFGDLGNAVRKIRIDLGIPIEFSSQPIHAPRDDGTKGSYCAVGRIRYSALDGADAADGVLICFKPVLCGHEPPDVLQYAAENKLFPQEPTLDQFFGESQFESYRKLGDVAVEVACAGLDCADSLTSAWAVSLIDTVRTYLQQKPEEEAWLSQWLQSRRATQHAPPAGDPDAASEGTPASG